MTAQKRYYEKRRKIVDDAKGKACLDCGNTYPIVCMDLHHVDPETKKFSPSQFHAHGIEAIRAELEKCVVLCANCHRIRTWNDRDVQTTLF